MTAAIEILFLPVMKKQLPEIVDFHLPFEGIFHNLALVSIDKQYPGHARKVICTPSGAWAKPWSPKSSWWWTGT